ncbi:hypothetical protein DBR17_10060 [Sphingomonas sp. HMWF008]|nr:hypothetical protein DBR17_10060 [Sphingomonas sp. HMWF008]
MIVLLLALAQAAVPAPTAAPRVSVDLPQAWRPAGCGASTGTDIVVCGARDAAERYRVHPLPEKYTEPDDIGIGFDLGKGARGDVHVEQGTLINGVTTKRAMVTIKMPF